MKNKDENIEERQANLTEKLKVCADEYFCEMCEYYPIYPVHGHFECPKCHYKTKCCEGAAQGI